MTTPGKIALGIFIALMALCQMGVFDPSFNAYFEGRALADKDWLERAAYSLFKPENLVAQTRSEDPIGFALMSAIPSFGITFVAYVFLMGLRAMAKMGNTDNAERAEDAETPSAS